MTQSEKYRPLNLFAELLLVHPWRSALMIGSLFFAALAEGVCGILVAVGLWTRASALACGVTLGIAFTFVHFGDPWDKDAGGEMAFLYLTVFLAIAALGPGALSLDARRNPGA